MTLMILVVGYIVVGIDTTGIIGVAIRPVNGIPTETTDGILQDMVGYNNKISLYYMPQMSAKEIDGKVVLVIWALQKSTDHILSLRT